MTVDELSKLLSYDRSTGNLIWRNRPSDRGFNKQFAGKVAGSKTGGYIIVQIDGRNHKAHRLVWALVTGSWPTSDLDHRDLDKANNRFDNLRPATTAQNHRNTGPKRTNRSGHKGVYWHKRYNKWCAKITRNRKSIFLGYFSNLDEAAVAYEQASRLYHKGFARTI